MTKQPTSSFRLPLEPYPGLRPFLDHEASLLLGREDQITQVVERLRDTHFVAIIGGSGSGKSSLIRAGVVPRLRAFGISEAGDYWIPVVYTPGTSSPKDNHGLKQPQQTPVTRLAWKLAHTLAPQKSDAETQALCDEIATFFRQGAGFTQLIRAYHELLPAHGPQPANARFLFVLDQFEELFHPNNRNSEDARLLIEAVIDHFADPDPRCFVVMTMRSEHLADCAAYLQLPEAINRSFYLIRRLKPEELRDVITGPAHVFLRLRQRADATNQQEVMFEPNVVYRLIADVECIEDDPDHLPLLQHLLARLWQTAKEREDLKAQHDIPTSITWDDLARAADPSRQNEPAWWRDNEQANTLRICLENWAQRTYLERKPEDRPLVDEVLRHLAFKDPNNGQYFQERIDVDEAELLTGVASPREELLRLLNHGFLDSVNYMFWDDENPALITLKVSHESFIRGWPHFRQLVDVEAERFDEFVTILRRCLDWVAGGQRNALLLEAADLERLDARALTSVFHDTEKLDDWFDVVRQSRDGERLACTKPHAQSFVRISRERQEQLERAKKDREDRIKEAEEFRRKTAEDQKERERQAEIARLAIDAKARQDEAKIARQDADLARAQEATSKATGEIARAKLVRRVQYMALGLAVLYFAFTCMVKDPAFDSIKLFSQAQTLTKTRRTSDGNPDPKAAMTELQDLLVAAQNTQRARQAFPIFFESPADREKSPFIARFGYWLKPLFPTREYEQLVRAASTEGDVNASLRSLLTSAIWSSQNVAQGKASAASAGNDSCEVPSVAAPPSKTPGQVSSLSSATMMMNVENKSSKTSLEHGIWIRSTAQDLALFIPNKKNVNDPIRLLQANSTGAPCKATRTVTEFPASPWPMALLIDDRVSRLALAQFDADAKPLTTVFSIEWRWIPQASASVIQIIPIRQLVEMSSALMPFQEVAAGERPNNPLIPAVKVLKTHSGLGGHDVEVAGKEWRLLSNRALPVITVPWSEYWVPLTTPKNETICAGIGNQTTPPEDGSHSVVRTEAWLNRDQGTCITVTRPGNPNPGKSSSRVPINVSVFDIPLSNKPIASTQPSTAASAVRQSSPDSGVLTPSADWVFDTLPMDQTNNWWVGKPGTKYEGWLAASPSSEGEAPKSAKAAPYSTGALIKLGCALWQSADPAFKPPNDGAGLKDICPDKTVAPKR